MPIWEEHSLNEITDKYTSKELTKDSFKEMRAELKKLGIESLMPLTLEKLIGKQDDKD